MADIFGGDSTFTASNIAGAAKSGISAVGSLFGSNVQAGGYEKEADLYDQAAMLETWNEQYAKQSGDIQKILATRQYNQTKGAAVAQAGANGFQMSGSNLDLMREGWNNLGITEGQIDLQTGINQATYQEQALGYQAQAAGARAAAQASKGGGIMDILGGIAGMAAKFLPI